MNLGTVRITFCDAFRSAKRVCYLFINISEERDVEIIDKLILGQWLSGLPGSIPARQSSKYIGLSDDSSALSVNQNCGSDMRAVEIAAQLTSGREPPSGQGRPKPV